MIDEKDILLELERWLKDIYMRYLYAEKEKDKAHQMKLVSDAETLKGFCEMIIGEGAVIGGIDDECFSMAQIEFKENMKNETV